MPASCPQGDAFSTGSLSAFWAPLDLGAHPASSWAEGGALTLTAGGLTSVTDSDSIFYLYQGVSNNLDVQLKVNYVPGNAATSKAGIMMRDSAAPDSPYVAVFVSRSNGYYFQYRTGTAVTTVAMNAGAL